MVTSRRGSRTKLHLQKNWEIERLPGLNSQDCQRLKACGIETTLQLCQQALRLPARQNLAARMQVRVQHIAKWAAMADLTRIPSVGCQYCGLLLHIGICSVGQLAQMPLHNLQKQVLRFYVAVTRQPDLCPDPGLMSQWIQQARQLAPKTD